MQKAIKMIANWKSILTIIIVLLCIQTPGLAVDVTLQWDKSIDDPYLPLHNAYKIYYDTDSRGVGPPYAEDIYDQTPQATHYRLEGADWVEIANSEPVPVDKNVTQISLRFSEEAFTYYFAVTAVDTRGLESDYSNEVSTLGITNITSTTADGAYKVGEVIDIKLTFSEDVTLSTGGNLRITLDTGDTIDITLLASESSVSGNYTVGEGDNSSDLNVTKIELTAGTLKNGDDPPLDCSLTLPSGKNLADNESIVIDTTAPTVAISYSESGPYKDAADTIITITATFTETNTIAGAQIAIDYAGDGNDVSATTMTEVSNKVWTYSMDVPAGNDGTARITITGADTAGNTLNDSANTFTVDNIAPSTPVITTDGGSGAGVDYTTPNSAISLEGERESAATIKINGSIDGVIYLNETSWEYTGTLNPGENTFNITAVDAAGNEGEAGSITVTYSSGNSVPDKPVLSSPENDEEVSLTPTFKTNDFSDPDGDAHAATLWKITNDNTSEVVFNVTSTVNLISLNLPDFVLSGNTPYSWTVIFYDNNGASSEATASFTTANEEPFPDNNPSNGIPDDQEVADTVNVNNNDTDDVYEISDNYKSVNTVDENDNVVGQMGISTEGVAATIEMLTAVNPGDLPDYGKPDNMDLGIVSFKLNVSSDESVDVTIYLSEAAPADAHWYKYSPASGWIDCTALGYATFSPDDRTSVTLTLKDGGFGDADGVENGVIIDPSGFDTPSIDSISTGGSASGGGCFIATAAFASPLDKHVNALRHLRDDILLLNKWGQSFVKTYYRYSPPVGDFIREHDTLRLMVRWSLLPVVGLSWMCLQIGATPTLLVLMAGLLMVFGVIGRKFARIFAD